ncbi:zinc-binding dehydrogenase, partial [Bacillus cereus]|uniref:zinc-binding dehydrogenase n=1 Tax=Bacillus cereus TaxID=1396 RepID=UPI000C03126A
DRLEYCVQLGAQGGVVRTDGLAALNDFGPFNVILDPVGGGEYAKLNVKLAAVDGRWVLIGLMGGRDATLDLAQVLGKRVQLLGSTLRTRDDQFKADLLSDLGQHVWP